jgi:hypothetical protein
MGDYSDREYGFVPLVYFTKRLCFESGLKQTCTDIIRFSYGASSSKKSYRSKFIPGLHDVVTITALNGEAGDRVNEAEDGSYVNGEAQQEG